jgi:hypothetical protein
MKDYKHDEAQRPAKAHRRTVVYPICLDDGYMGQIVIPYDLNDDESQRLQAFIAALVVPWQRR